MPPIGMLADRIRRNRRPASANNPFIAIEENASRQIVAGLDTWRDMAASSAERTFLAVYGSQPLQTASGVDRDTTKRARFAPKSLLHRDLVQRRLGELLSRLSIGGLREAVIRGLLFAGMARNSVDERGFEMLRAIRKAHDDILYQLSRRSYANSLCCFFSTAKVRLLPFLQCFPANPRNGSEGSISSDKS